MLVTLQPVYNCKQRSCQQHSLLSPCTHKTQATVQVAAAQELFMCPNCKVSAAQVVLMRIAHPQLRLSWSWLLAKQPVSDLTGNLAKVLTFMGIVQ